MTTEDSHRARREAGRHRGDGALLARVAAPSKDSVRVERLRVGAREVEAVCDEAGVETLYEVGGSPPGSAAGRG